ncbi:sensor histidine kinase [Streptomyces sp. NPDC002537]
MHGYPADAAIAVATAATLVLRRRRPEICLLAGLASSFAYDERFLLFAGAYAVAHYGRKMRFGLVAAVIVIYVLARSALGMADATVEELYCGVVTEVAFPAVFGSLVRHQRSLRDLFRQRLEKAESTVDAAIRFALLEERTRLAFDIHDHIGHHATFLVLQAGALQQTKGLSEEARQGTVAVQESAQQVMSDLRQLLKVVRDTGTDQSELISPTRCADFLAGLVGNMSAVGMAAEYELHGTVQPLPQDIELLLYRLCRETFTNAAKHAPGARVRADLSFEDDRVILAVRNGPSMGAALGSSSRMGLAGLRLRVAEVGGHLTAGPTRDGGFHVKAELPCAPPSASPSSPQPSSSSSSRVPDLSVREKQIGGSPCPFV